MIPDDRYFLDDTVTIQPGASLDSYATSKFFVRSLRIDNPTGCWYFVQNSRLVIPPYTIGAIVRLGQEARSITIKFLPSYAGQQSKIVGNPLTVYMTTLDLPPSPGKGILSAISYTNTFVAYFSLAVTNGVRNVFVSIWPGATPMRIRINHVAVYWAPTVSTGAIVQSGIQLSPITADGAGSIVTPLSQDGDTTVQSQCTVRSSMPATGAIPTVSTVPLRQYRALVTPIVGGRLYRSYGLGGPDIPPSIYSTAASPRGLALGFSLAAATSPGVQTGSEISWTEEALV